MSKKYDCYFKEIHDFKHQMHIELLAFELSMFYKHLNGSDSLIQSFNTSFEYDVFSFEEKEIF